MFAVHTQEADKKKIYIYICIEGKLKFVQFRERVCCIPFSGFRLLLFLGALHDALYCGVQGTVSVVVCITWL